MQVKEPRRILVPTDFSDSADRALEWALALAKAFQSTIDLIHVSANVMVLPPPFEMVSFPALYPDLPRRLQESLDARVERVRNASLPCTSAQLEGNPHVEIVRHAEATKPDLIVMGTHGRSGISHAVLGSVAERVTQKSACPVLVVPLRDAGETSPRG